MKHEIDSLFAKLDGLSNDAHLWDLVRTYGKYSTEVLNHLRACERAQSRGENHT